MQISSTSDESYRRQQNKLAEIIGTVIALLTLIAPPLLVAFSNQPLVINQQPSMSVKQ